MRLPLFHLALWVLLGLLFEHSLRLDSAEGAIAGIEWLLAHPKHPPMPFWVVELSRQFGFTKYFMLFTFSYSFMLAGVWIIVKFAREKWGENSCFVALLVCLASPFLTYIPLQMNHNITLFPFWALVIIYGWKAIDQDKWQDWLILSLAIAFGLYAKYAISLVVLPLLVFILWQKRSVFTSPKAYIAAIIATLILIPHLKAELEIFNQVVNPLREGSQSFAENLLHSSGFALNCLLILAPAFIILKLSKAPFLPKTQFQKYAALMAFFPMVFIITLALLLGVRPRPLWLTPFILGIALYTAAQLEGRAFNPKPFYGVYSLFVVSFLALKLVNPLVGKPTYSDYDAKATLKLVEQYYAKNMGNKDFPYIISLGAQRGRQLAGSLVFEMERPVSVLEEGLQQFSPWVNEALLKEKGALIVSTLPIHNTKFKIEHQEALPRPLKSHFFQWKDAPVFYVGIVVGSKY